jgi:UDP-glucuronate decarboxylase
VSLNNIIQEDVRDIFLEIGGKLKILEGSNFLISGGGGFLGSYFMDLLKYCNDNIFLEPATVICIDNFITGVPERVKHLLDNDNFKIIDSDISKPLELNNDVDYIIHAASIASPTFYRKYPIKTLETNVLGLKNLVELGMKKNIKSFLNMSSSEIYGDPDAAHIPTREDYNGNVSCTGPRACYDESKRMGETMCANYYKEYGMPIKIARPFNVYGPGLKLGDRRVIPDFFNDAINRHKIEILSDGSPTRSFCYVSDAIKGFMLALLSEFNGEAFNIGDDQTEISMRGIAELIAEIVGNVEVKFNKSDDTEYLTDNPKRRCPDLTKAKTFLNYYPKVELKTGLKRIYQWYMQTNNL